MGDLEARGLATAERFRGRAVVVAEFLRATATAPKKEPAAETRTSTVKSSRSTEDRLLLSAAIIGEPAKILVDVPSKKLTRLPIAGIRRLQDGRIEIDVGNVHWVEPTEVTTFETAPWPGG